MTLTAPAKINLGLQIVGRRTDGFHDIDTVFHRIGLADEITLRRTGAGITLTCSDPSLPDDDDNLCVRAARRILDAAGCHDGVHIDLLKRIPDGAGLGGGSSDAAATLAGIRDLYALEIDDAALHGIAASIGSDVPFFLLPGDAHALGRGEILRSIDIDFTWSVVVVHPNVRVATAWAYGALRLPRVRVLEDLVHAWRVHGGNADALRTRVRNDFEDVVLPAHPPITAARTALADAGAAFTLMSGSGSSIFGLFADTGSAEAAAARLEPRWRTHVTAGIR